MPIFYGFISEQEVRLIIFGFGPRNGVGFGQAWSIGMQLKERVIYIIP